MAGRDNTSRLTSQQPRLFTPQVSRAIREENTGINIFQTEDGTITSDSSLGISSSFKYNAAGTGIMSTQQLNIDWTNFAEHTFFNSAQVKTNVAFQKVLDEYPFDGTRQSVEVFIDKLTGYEKWIYDQFPKHKDYLFFSGTQVGETVGGTVVVTKDIAGVAYPFVSTNITGETILNPGFSPMTVEFQIYLPTETNGNAVVLDKHIENSGTDKQGFYISLDSTISTGTGSLSFHIMSGSVIDSVEAEVIKGEWNHVAWTWDRNSNVNSITSYVNQTMFASSSQPIEFDYISAAEPDLLIGSGSAITGEFVPNTTFSGALDELRIWHSVRTPLERANYEKKSVFAQDSLKLYYKFNEPPETSSAIVVDASDNSIHGRLGASALLLGSRAVPSGSVAGSTPMTFEKLTESPVLFPDYPAILTLQTGLLTDAANYDEKNPNLITKLIPSHYLLQGQSFEGLETEHGALVTGLTTGSDPRSSKLGGTQALLLLLYTWAKFFDEMKLYTQAFADMNFVDYDDIDTVPNAFLQNLAQRNGITLPPLYQGSTIDQFVNAENIQSDISTNDISLQQVQNVIWRRILINMRDFMTSKGTMHSVKSFIRSMGIDPDSNFRIREYGGPNKQTLEFVRDKKTEYAGMLDFGPNTTTDSKTGNFLSAVAQIVSPEAYAQSNRTEPGWPIPSVSANSSFADRYLFTSGSWTIEQTVRLRPEDARTTITQSLGQLVTQGADGKSGQLNTGNFLISNLLHCSGGVTTLFHRPGNNIPLKLVITGADLFDGDPWYVSFGCRRGDDPFHPEEPIQSDYSSSIFLRLAKQQNGEIVESYVTSSFYSCFVENAAQSVTEPLAQEFAANGVLGHFQDSNGSGARWWVQGSGSWDIAYDTSGFSPAWDSYLNSSALTASLPLDADQYRYSEYTGKIAQFRLWSKYLADTEWKEHVRNYRSVGVVNPEIHWNFNTTETGSFNKLRMDVSLDQPVTSSENTFFQNNDVIDYTQNYKEDYYIYDVSSGTYLNITSSNSLIKHSIYDYPVDAQAIVPQRFDFSYISPKYDMGSTVNKVRVRGYQDYDLVQDTPWAQVSPVTEIARNEEPTDNERFTIDFSIIDALDQDIITIFGNLDYLDNAIGDPNLAFSGDYPDLYNLRKQYFNKLTDKMNLKGFFEFFKWFDNNIGTFVAQLLPRKTKFQGTNFVIESHMLERPKIEYQFEDIYLGESNRSGLKDTILMQLITGDFNRY